MLPLDIGANSSVGSEPYESNGAKESVMPFSPWPMPSIPDADLGSFALRHAVRLADRPALIADRVITYGELAERVERGARELAGRDVVSIRLPNGPEFVFQLLAALRAGAAVIAVSPLLTDRETAHQLRVAHAPDDVALLLSSSGTTGLPKVVALTHRSVVSNLCQT